MNSAPGGKVCSLASPRHLAESDNVWILSSVFSNKDAGGEANRGDSGTASSPDGLISIASFIKGESEGVVLISEISLATDSIGLVVSLGWELVVVWMTTAGEPGSDAGVAVAAWITAGRGVNLQSQASLYKLINRIEGTRRVPTSFPRQVEVGS